MVTEQKGFVVACVNPAKGRPVVCGTGTEVVPQKLVTIDNVDGLVIH